jgi:glycylpeptide N-tetradecanoyltransferase
MDPKQSEEVYTLLTENYVEDDDAMFRFDYSIPFLHWALTPPGYKPELHLGVRSSKSGKLMAFISGVPAKVFTDVFTVCRNIYCMGKAIILLIIIFPNE